MFGRWACDAWRLLPRPTDSREEVQRFADMECKHIHRERLLRLSEHHKRYRIREAEQQSGVQPGVYGQLGRELDHVLLRDDTGGQQRDREHVLERGVGHYSLIAEPSLVNQQQKAVRWFGAREGPNAIWNMPRQWFG